MNIKYRLLCKRLIEERKRVGVIQYYNVLFIMELLSDKDIWSLERWVNVTATGRPFNVSLLMITLCSFQSVFFGIRFFSLPM